MNPTDANNPPHVLRVFNVDTSEILLDHVSRQILSITDLQESETKTEVVQNLSFELMWLQFWEFSIITGAEFGWSIQQCYEFRVYDIYKLQEELEKRSEAACLALSKSTFPTWLLNRDTLNMPLHEQTYPFYEVKVM